jgi:MFS family permease
LWAAGLLSQAGSQVGRIGLMLFLFGTAGSPLSLAAFIVADTLPGAVAAPLGGVLTDRVSKRAVMIASDLVRMVCAAVIAWHPVLPVLAVSTIVHSVARALFQPARAAAVPLIVEPAWLVDANSVERATSNLVIIVAPVVGAELLVRGGLAAVLLTDAALLLASALLISGVVMRDVPRPATTLTGAAVVRDIGEGWRYVWRHPLARQLTAVFFVSLLCAGTWTPLAPFFVRDHLGSGSRVLGLQFAAFGCGAVMGSLVVARIIARFGRGMTVFGGLIAEALVQTAYATVPFVSLSMTIIFLWGVAVTIIAVPFYAILQTAIDARFLGRAFAAVGQSESLATVFAMVGTMVLQQYLDSRTILLGAGVLYGALALASSLTNGGRALLGTR